MDFEAGGAAALLGDGDAAGGVAASGVDGAAVAASGGDGAKAGAADGAAEGALAELPEWAKGLSADVGDGETLSNADWVKGKGFKDLDAMAKSLRHAEKALHDTGRVKVPGEGASAEELTAFHKAIGVPDDARGYSVTLPETSGGLELDTGMIDKLATVAHAAGLPKAGFEAVANAFVAEQVAQHLEGVKAQDDEAAAKMKEWGDQKDAKIADCQAAMRGLGIDRIAVAQLQQAWGSAKALDFLAKIGGGMAEDRLITGGSGRFGVSAAEAQREIDAIKADPERMGKIKPGTPEKARWDSLLAVIGAERDRQQKDA